MFVLSYQFICMNKPYDIVCSEPALKYMLVLRQVLPFCAISLFGQWGLGHQRFHWQPLQNAKQFKSLLSPTATSGGTWLEDLHTNRLRWGQRAMGGHVRGPHWGADLQPGHWHWHQEEVLHILQLKKSRHYHPFFFIALRPFNPFSAVHLFYRLI